LHNYSSTAGKSTFITHFGVKKKSIFLYNKDTAKRLDILIDIIQHSIEMLRENSRLCLETARSMGRSLQEHGFTLHLKRLPRSHMSH